jgi:hypothetical protein
MTTPPPATGHAYPSAPAPEKTAPLWEDFVDIFVAPASVFARRRHGAFGLALLALTILVTVLFFGVQPLIEPVLEAELDRQTAAGMAANPQITPEMAEAQRNMGMRFMPLFILFGLPIGVLLTGVFVWLAGKAVEARQPFRAAFVIATYSQFPRIIEQISYGIQGVLLDLTGLVSRYQLSIGPARFLDPFETNPILLGVAVQLDLFAVWVTVLIAVGLAVIGGIPRSRAAIGALMVWLVGTLMVVFTVSRQ